MHQRTGKAWKVAIPVVLLLLGATVGILAFPVIGALYHHAVDASPTSFVPFANPASQTRTPIPTPTSQDQRTPTTQTPSYIAGLSSGDPRIFVESFSKALVYRDTANLSKHKSDQFLEMVQSSENPPPSDTPACTNHLPSGTTECSYNWDDIARQLSNDSIELIVDPTAQMTVQVVPADPAYGGTETDATILGKYTNNNSNLPLAHTGTAKFTFGECCVGSGTTTYVWTFVYLWPMV